MEPHSCWQTCMALCRTEAALQQNYKHEIKRPKVDHDSHFLIPYKSNLERLQIEQKTLVIWHSNTSAELFCYGICSAFHWFLNSFHKVIPKLMRALQVLLSGWKKTPKHLRKSLIISTANSFCSMLAYFLIHGEIQGHKFSSCDFQYTKQNLKPERWCQEATGEIFLQEAAQICSYIADLHKDARKAVITEQSYQPQSRGRSSGKQRQLF